jgi:ribose transport system substrate-binding protein
MDAAKKLGVKAEFVGPMDANLAAQIKTWEELNARPDTAGIFWYPMDFNAGEPLVVASKAKGISVVIGAADTPFPTRDAFIGYDNKSLGYSAAEVMAAALNGKGKVGSMGNLGPNVVERQQAMRDYMKEKYPNVVTIEPAAHEGSVDSATKNLQAYMTKNPDLDFLWFADGLGGSLSQVWKEYQQAGKKTKFLAMDMPPVCLQAVKDGIYFATIGQDTFTEEFWGVQLIYAAYHGIRVPNKVFLKTLILNQGNVDPFLKE